MEKNIYIHIPYNPINTQKYIYLSLDELRPIKSELPKQQYLGPQIIVPTKPYLTTKSETLT